MKKLIIFSAAVRLALPLMIGCTGNQKPKNQRLTQEQLIQKGEYLDFRKF